jgi:hypothetical protein
MFSLVLATGVFSCSKESENAQKTLFTRVDSKDSNIDFANELTFDEKFNIYTYRNFYNGGGVALGDINNDGLIDIYFTANQKDNKLYLNKGNFKFEDITEKAGVGGKQLWCTGASMADINGDGLIDIYVSNSGKVGADPNKQNELFINNGDLTFTERAQEFGLADKGYTTHAAFFDYDKDGDLDAYILNNSFQAIGTFNLMKNERGKRDALGGHKLLRNDNNVFKDVSVEAGIYGSVISFGLGVTVGDVDRDGWQDIYVSNDFFERDYLYINNHDGTFSESLPAHMKSISAASMGADMADVNNDGFPELFVTEMLPHDNARLKTVTTFEDWNRYQYNLTNDYYHQFTRNMFQVNNGNGTFSELGRLVGVEATDWSWAALMADYNNDGLKDIFVANGITRDLTNQDFLQFASGEEFVKTVLTKGTVDYKRLVEVIPSTMISNYLFENQGNLTFTDKTKDYGLTEPSFSNGSAYGDLDNDGDLDLVVNNNNMPSFLYRNESQTLFPENHYIKFQLTGDKKNTAAFGARVTLYDSGQLFYQEQMPIRGFESTMDSRLNFGLGKIKELDSLKVEWPDGSITLLNNVKTNQTLKLQQTESNIKTHSVFPEIAIAKHTIFQEVKDNLGITFKHEENKFVDFDRDRLTFQMLSTQGPKITTGDINGDGLEDLFVGGAKDQPGALYLQKNERFQALNEPAFGKDKVSEDLGCVMFDADQDKDIDLFVASGGNEFSTSSPALSSRLYLNDGKTKLTRDAQPFPAAVYESASCVKAADYDNDGDTDLFVGIRLAPFSYGLPCNGYILNNDGAGQFNNVTNEIASGLTKVGMITDASWADIDGDKDTDLIVVGEWMEVKVFKNENGKFADATLASGLEKSNGWWNTIEPVDFDKDGDIDFVVGNHGLNSRFRASIDKPASMYVSDFDKNGSIEQIICVYNGDNAYPMALKHDLIQQMPSLRKRYLKYEQYKDQKITDIFPAEELKSASVLFSYNFASVTLTNDGTGKFTVKQLPLEAQVSPTYGILADDIDGDGNTDIVLGGNLYNVKPEAGRYDASFGLFLKGDGKGNFLPVKSRESGLFVDGEVRSIQKITVGKNEYVVFSRNNDSLKLFKISR